jgi:Sigma-70 region 2
MTERLALRQIIGRAVVAQVESPMSTNVLADFRAQPPEPSDEQLLSEARSGDGRAFAGLCHRYSGILRQRMFRIVRHREDAEDVLRETFLSAYLHLDSFRGACKFYLNDKNRDQHLTHVSAEKKDIFKHHLR